MKTIRTIVTVITCCMSVILCLVSCSNGSNIKGKVVESNTGQGLQGVVVTAKANINILEDKKYELRTTTSDKEGSFILKDLLPNYVYNIDCEKKGYASGNPYQISSPQKGKTLLLSSIIKLMKLQPFSFSIYDEFSKKALEGVKIEAKNIQNDPRGRKIDPMVQQVEAGKYNVTIWPFINYSIELSKPGYVSSKTMVIYEGNPKLFDISMYPVPNSYGLNLLIDKKYVPINQVDIPINIGETKWDSTYGQARNKAIELKTDLSNFRYFYEKDLANIQITKISKANHETIIAYGAYNDLSGKETPNIFPITYKFNSLIKEYISNSWGYVADNVLRYFEGNNIYVIGGFPAKDNNKLLKVIAYYASGNQFTKLSSECYDIEQKNRSRIEKFTYKSKVITEGSEYALKFIQVNDLPDGMYFISFNGRNYLFEITS